MMRCQHKVARESQECEIQHDLRSFNWLVYILKSCDWMRPLSVVSQSEIGKKKSELNSLTTLLIPKFRSVNKLNDFSIFFKTLHILYASCSSFCSQTNV